jgi:hypothetical protein
VCTVEQLSNTAPLVVQLFSADDLTSLRCRFAAYGGDKAAQTFAIRAAEFEFEVQPSVFIVHVEHDHATWRAQ